MTDSSFHYFPQLPLELRRLIWEQCLPHRVAEEDVPVKPLDGQHSRQACWARRTTDQNAKPPAIAFVNGESRQVALEQGHEAKPHDCLESIWVQPRRDVLHLNWTRQRFDILYGGGIADTTDIFMFLWQRAADLGVRPSVGAEILHPFSLQALLDGDVASNSPYIHLSSMPANKDMRDIVSFAKMVNCADYQLDVAMAAISLHITREAALRSGLFGLLGDAPVQMVDFDDEARLREFHTLFRESVLDKEPAVQALFEMFPTSQFQTAVGLWMRQLDWTFLAQTWRWQWGQNLDILGSSPGSAWEPELSDNDLLTMKRHLPNDKYPWVKQARRIMPKLRPKIMVRYCSNECYIKERLPRIVGIFC